MKDGLCKCGCGLHTSKAKRNIYVRGTSILKHSKGAYQDYVYQHNFKKNCNGIFVDRFGYIRVKTHGTVISNQLEHKLIAENVLGRPLKNNEEVHHIDGNPSNNAHNNLLICDHAYHMDLHKRQRAYRACGHASWRKCPFCKKYDDINNMEKDGHHYRHKECRSKYWSENKSRWGR